MIKKNDTKEQAAKGIVSMLLNRVIVKAVSFITKLVLARILFPQDFGIVAMGMVFISFLGYMNHFGFGEAIIQRQKKSEKYIDTSLVFLSCVGIALFVISWILAPLIAGFYNETVLKTIIRILAISFILRGVSIIPSAVLEKELAFKKVLLIEICSIVMYALFAISMAFMGYGFWSLVWSYVIADAVKALVVWIVRPIRFHLTVQWNILSQLFKFGREIILGGIISFILLQGDDALVGKVLGAGILGWYVMAYNISNFPAVNVAHIISGVAFPLFAKVQKHKVELQLAFVKITKIAALFILPATAGIFLLGRIFTKVILGDKWLPIVPALQILCIFGILRTVHILFNQILIATGQPEWNRRILCIDLILMVLIIYPFTKYGSIAGTSIAMSLAILPGAIISIIITLKKVKVTYTQMLNQLSPIVISCLIMGAGVLVMSRSLPETLSTLIISIVSGFFLFAISILLLDKQLKEEILEFIHLLS